MNKDETELRVFFVAITLPCLFLSSSKKKRHRIKRERAVMTIKKFTGFRLIMYKIYEIPDLVSYISLKILKLLKKKSRDLHTNHLQS